jgi:GT2 family glycosyltransferase
MAVKYNVIIPVVNRDLAAALLDSIAANTIIPDNILIIDNSMVCKAFPFDGRLPIEIIDSGKRLGVNASWNLGIREAGGCDYLAILNDDVILGKHFFESNIEVFRQYKDCGVACPATVHDMAELKRPGAGRIVRMKKREGWAFSFRWSLLKEIPPIPAEMVTFCGDDWFWVYTRLNGYHWYKDTGNIVYHEVGAAVKKLGVRSHLRRDRTAFEGVIK